MPTLFTALQMMDTASFISSRDILVSFRRLDSQRHVLSMKKTLILDNGAYEIKAGLAGSKPTYLPKWTYGWQRRCVPNCIARSKGDRRVYIGEQLRSCKDYGAMGFKRAFDRVWVFRDDVDVGVFNELGDGEGYLGYYIVWWGECGLSLKGEGVNLDWSRRDVIACYGTGSGFTYFTGVVWSNNLWGVRVQFVLSSCWYPVFIVNLVPSLIPWHNDIRGSLSMAECVLVVDCGFSFTHVTPVVNGKVIWSAVKRYFHVRAMC